MTDNQDAAAAVKADDKFYDENEEYSSFEMTASLGIIDVPAGTNYEVTIQRYDGTLAQGAVIYDGDYGTYNYTIEKTAEKGEWRFVSMIACTR